jgi:hypothetical protein
MIKRHAEAKAHGVEGACFLSSHARVVGFAANRWLGRAARTPPKYRIIVTSWHKRPILYPVLVHSDRLFLIRYVTAQE